MIPVDIKAKMSNAFDIFNAKLNTTSDKWLFIADTHEHFIIRQYKRFPIAYHRDAFLYKATIKDDVLRIAEGIAKIQSSFVIEIDILKSFMFFLDPMNIDSQRYHIKSRWLETLNECIVGDPKIIASYAKQ
jgi:hypothetical protein